MRIEVSEELRDGARDLRANLHGYDCVDGASCFDDFANVPAADAGGEVFGLICWTKHPPADDDDYHHRNGGAQPGLGFASECHCILRFTLLDESRSRRASD